MSRQKQLSFFFCKQIKHIRSVAMKKNTQIELCDKHRFHLKKTNLSTCTDFFISKRVSICTWLLSLAFQPTSSHVHTRPIYLFHKTGHDSKFTSFTFTTFLFHTLYPNFPHTYYILNPSNMLCHYLKKFKKNSLYQNC